MTREIPDRLTMQIWRILALVGAGLALVGWYRALSGLR
jgi:hypothetical protein